LKFSELTRHVRVNFFLISDVLLSSHDSLIFILISA
jgi:hypothetical protein